MSLRNYLLELVEKFHKLLGINEINIHTLSDVELCEELDKCISDVSYEYNVVYPIYNQCFGYYVHKQGYQCSICKKCFVDQDEAEMHYRMEHRNKT